MKSPRKISLAKRICSFGIFNIRKSSKSMHKQKYKNKRCLSAEGFLLLPSALRPRLLKALSIFLIFLSFSLAAETFWLTDEVSAATLEITVPANYSINLDPGTGTTFGESSSQQISIKTSGSFGYTLNIKPGSDTNLKNGSNIIKAIAKSEGYDNGDLYKSSEEVNTWAYKPGKLNSVDNTKYLPFPSMETLLDKTSSNNDTANAYDFIIAAKVDNTLPSGTYSNNFVISATANTVSYSITYNLNSGTWNGTSPQTGTTTENKIKLDSNKPTRENYEFLGWCSTQTTNETCNGDIKQPGDEITLTNNDNQFIFYGLWKATMQGFKCSQLNQNQTTTLIDPRDGNVYTIAKLLDNKCWMTENLRIGSNDYEVTLTSETSDIDSDFVLPKGDTAPGTINGNEGWNYLQYNTKHIYIDENHDEKGNIYGGYYTWFTVTAGKGTTSVSSGDLIYSICPKGWKLPSKSDFDTLVSKYNYVAASNPPANFFLSGYCDDGGCPRNRGNNAPMWSSTAYSDARTYSLNLNNSNFYVSNSAKGNGFTIRCISRN